MSELEEAPDETPRVEWVPYATLADIDASVQALVKAARHTLRVQGTLAKRLTGHDRRLYWMLVNAEEEQCNREFDLLFTLGAHHLPRFFRNTQRLWPGFVAEVIAEGRGTPRS